ncbi:MAG: gluconeogenesis factor YvcK family protein [Solirubrobacteraceae bacterium]
MATRVAILGGGHGIASVLRALRDYDDYELTAVVTVGDDGGSSGELRRRNGGHAVGDMRRSLLALSGDDVALARALAQPVTLHRFGRHPLGNLVIRSLATALGDLEAASGWLAVQLGAGGRVLPATLDPVSLIAEAGGELIRGESAIGAANARIRRLRFSPERPRVPTAALAAIADADWVLLGPGSLFTSVLAVSAVPDVASALRATSATVAWVCNLERQHAETSEMSAPSHLAALRRHGVRVDLVLHDPSAELHFTPRQLARARVPAIARPLAGALPGVHDPDLLALALGDLFDGSPHAVPIAA